MILVHDVRESTDTYMIYDQIFTVHTTHTHTHTSVTIIFYIYDCLLGAPSTMTIDYEQYLKETVNKCD